MLLLFLVSFGRYWSTLARDVPFAGLMVSETVTSVHLMVLCLLIVVLFLFLLRFL